MKTILMILAGALGLGAIVLLIKVVGGTFALMNGAVNAALGFAVILALVLIVVWMFWYAKRH